LTATGQPSVQAARSRDLPQILALVQQAAAARDLNPQYLELPYFVGLARDLLFTVWLKRFRGDAPRAMPASLHVIRQGPDVVAFSLLRDRPATGNDMNPRELYLLCVAAPARRQGLATALVDHALMGLQPRQQLVIQALRQCKAMARLMRRRDAIQTEPAGRPLHRAPPVKQAPTTRYVLQRPAP
jgi:GNAT superfamily N-acetyltransferase